MTGTVSYFISAVLSLAATVPAWIFVLRYHYKSKGMWKATDLGRSLMSLGMSLAATLTFITFNAFWVIIVGPLYESRGLIGLCLFASITYALWRLVRSFEKIQKEQ